MKEKDIKAKKSVSEMIDEISDKYNSTIIDPKLLKLRNSNHEKYYNLDILFLKGVDAKYKVEANNIIAKYNKINAKNLLLDNKNVALSNLSLLDEIDKNIINLKEKIKSDLNVVIDYVDKLWDKIDVSNIDRNIPLGILILNKLDAFKIFSADLDLNDINGTMSKQSKRLMYLKELNYLINVYNNSNTKYNKDNTAYLVNNLYEIIGKYLFLLTDTEFEYTKEAIKKLLAYRFDFIDKYLPTYKIILSRIWNSEFTGDYYFICNLDLNKDDVYLMNDNNAGSYDEAGYVCDIPRNFIDYFKMSAKEIINFPLPSNLKNSYLVAAEKVDNKDIKFKAIYTKNNNVNYKSILPIIRINKNKN